MRAIKKIIFILCFTNQVISFAASNDQHLPLFITADTVTYNRNTNIGVFTGHVHIIQGTTEIFADQLITYNKQSKLTKAIAFGKPAHYKTLPDNNKVELFADANKLEYYPEHNLILLEDNAHVKQGDNSLQSSYLLYDTKNSLVTARGANQKRIKITFQPNQVSKIST